jgi:xanthine dehydrogenase accessory factor
MSHETFELIDTLRRSGRRAAMATLVRTHGTTPRKEGTKMFVGDDGSIFGSVTIGGCVDARVIERAREVLATSTPHLLNLQLGDEDAWEIGLTCGGKVDVFIEPLDAVANLYELAKGRAIAIATDLRSGAHALIEPPDGRSRMLNDQVYVEVLRPASTMFIFGAGAVAIPLVMFARAVGFRTILVDGRPQFASRERFPEADEIRIGIASELAEKIAFDSTTPVVLVAHDYKYDIPILKRVLATDAPYVGLLGSRKRGAAIKQMLLDDGVAEDQLRRVHVPIGLDIGGETAAEIALSIVAEVVAVVHGRNGNPLHVR